MEENSLALARYWRNSLADAELGYGGLEIKETESFLQLQEQELATGRVGTSIIKKCFAREAQHIQTVEVVIRPKVYLYRLEHGKRRHSGVPDLVTPLVTRALLARDGRLYPSTPTVIPRDILDPLERGSFVIGTVSDQDEFLTRNPMPSIAFSEEGSVPESDFEQEWASYLAACEQLLSAVGQGWPTGEDGFELAPYSYLAKEESTQGTRRHIIPVYDRIRDHTPIAPLFDRYASQDVSDLEPCLSAHAGVSVRLGHSSDSFPLALAQRDALTHQLVAQPSEILALNGPPGTGKTTLLLSVVASLWAQAALEGGEPPVILAASTNNQAVTNIIDAFGKDFSQGTGPLAGRWLPEINSFGAYFPSLKKENARTHKYQTRSFFEKVESSDYVVAAETAYLQAAAHAFPNIAAENLTVETIVTALQLDFIHLRQKWPFEQSIG